MLNILTQCTECDKTFSTEQMMLRHKKPIHIGNEVQIPCIECN